MGPGPAGGLARRARGSCSGVSGAGGARALRLRAGAGIQRLLPQTPNSLGGRRREARLFPAPLVARTRTARHHARPAWHQRTGKNVTNCDYIFSAKSTIERIAMPVGPFASHGRPSSTQQVEAMSRWIHGVSSANSLMNHAPVLAPPPLPLPVLRMSAMSLLIIC